MPKIDNVDIEIDKGNAIIIRISDISDDLKEIIRKNISSICYGNNLVQNSKHYDSKSTIAEFLLRYKKKDNRTKKGMIGELLAHSLILQLLPDFIPSSPYFNSQERSIKKGFDIVYFESKTKEIWLAEAKSGETKKHDSKAKTSSLVQAAKRDIYKKMNDVNLMQWQTAIGDVGGGYNKDQKRRFGGPMDQCLLP